MKLNDLLTTIENIEHSVIILYPRTKSPFDRHRIDCTLCSDENNNYFFTMDDNPDSEKIFSTDQIPSTIKSIEFQIAFKLPTQEKSQ